MTSFYLLHRKKEDIVVEEKYETAGWKSTSRF